MPVKETPDQHQLEQLLEQLGKPCVHWADFACILAIEDLNELKWVLLDVEEA